MKAGDGKPRSKVRRACRNIGFRVTDEVYKELQARAKDADLDGPNAFARDTVLGSHGFGVRQKQALIGNLGRIGADLRALAQNAERRGDHVSAQKERQATEAVLELLRDIAQTSR